jgi:hypothetical protein
MTNNFVRTVSLAQNVQWFRETMNQILSSETYGCKLSDLPADPLKPSDIVIVSLGTPEYKLFQNGRTRIVLINESWSSDLSKMDMSGVILLLDPKTGLNLRNKIGNIHEVYFPLWGKFYSENPHTPVTTAETQERKFGVAMEKEHKITHILSHMIKKKCDQEIEYKNDFKELSQHDYYFIFVIETTKCKGCVSEQLLKAKTMCPKMIPVYWGAPDIKDYFNSKSFINVSDFSSYEALADRLLNITKDEKIYSDYINASPCLTEYSVSCLSPSVLDKTFRKVLPAIKRVIAPIDSLKQERPERPERRQQERAQLSKPKEAITLLPQINKTFKDLVLEQKKIEAEDKQYMYPKLSKTIEPPTIITKQAKLYGTRKDQQPRKVGC